MNLPDFLNDVDGEIRLTGHRIRLYDVVLEFNEGDCAEMIACRYPSLRLSHIYKVIGFYLENQHEVDDYVAKYSADLEELRRNGRHIDLEELRQRLALREKANVSQPQAH
jgi:uncharacterized protein (DUF433 family)